MRNIYIIIISLILISCHRFRGVYYTPPIAESDVVTIEFLKNKRFKYEINGCLGTSTYGVGNYKIDNNHIKFIYGDTIYTMKSNYTLIDKEKSTSKDSIQLNFEVKDKFNNNLVNIYGAYIRRKSDPRNPDKFATDKNGHLSINVKKNDTVQNFQVQYFGYENLNIPINTNSSKEIIIELDTQGPKIISDTTRVIDIKKFRRYFRKVKKK